ncbi:MAG TPA: NYN domain-containing protein [Alphaproteobacteria bacterium]|nr:NYN domain-containing protein [Alphaproteobacteria bacterium]
MVNINSQDRIGLFIDGSNLYAAARALAFDIDYKRLLDAFAEKGRLIRAFYYTALIEDQEYSPIRPLVDWLDYNGYTMVTKPAKEFTDSMGRRKIKGNMDIELAVDMIEMAPVLDHVVLFSGDGDFRRLVEAVQRKGLLVSVVSTVRSQPPMVADELRRQADNFIELQDLQPKIARAPQLREGDEREGPSAAQIHQGFDADDDDEFPGEPFEDEDGDDLADAR